MVSDITFLWFLLFSMCHLLHLFAIWTDVLYIYIVNRQYGLESSKYVVILDPLPTGHVTRSMRSELLAFNISKSTGKSGNLESHKLYVLSNRRLRDCRFSGKRFKCTHELKRHVYTHTGAKPYPCGHCSDSFTLVRDLKAHLLKSHNEGTWFICHTCQKKFSLSSHLKQHLLRHEAVEW